MAIPETNVLRWPQGKGEMAARIRAHPWHRSAIGPTARWPAHLRTATDLMIGSAVPTLLLVGGDGVVLYNDALVPFLGSRHPSLLGLALSTASAEAAAKFRAITGAIQRGDTVITDDNWLGLPEEATQGMTRLSCTPLRNAKGDIGCIWAQMLNLPLRRAEPQLPATEIRWPASLTASGLAAWIWKVQSGELSLTDGAADIFGVLPHQQDSLVSPHFELVHPLDRDARSAALDHTIETGEAYRCEFRIVRPCDQEIAWLEERGQIVRDPRTGRTLLSVVMWDISDRKLPHRQRANGQSGESEYARYAAALDIDTVGVAFFRADGVVTEANDAYCTLHGIDRMDVIAGHVRWGDGTAQEWLTLLRRSMYEFQVSGRVLPHEKECVRPDGKRWWGLFSARRLSETEGVEYVVDISTRMQAEQNLKDSERRARTLMEGIPLIVWRAADGGQWIWASPQWTDLTGQPQSQSHGLGWLDMVHPDDREEAHAIWDLASWQQVFEANYRLWHIGENRYRAFKTRAAPIRDEAGGITEWFGTSTDIEDLQQLHGRLRVLVAELQHRTRNLLALVRAIAAQTIGRGPLSSREQYLAFIERLGALSRAQSLITRADLERADLESLLRAELAALRGGDSGQIEVRGPPVPLTPVHAQTLALVTHELATNAVKYGALHSRHGRLSISWRTEQTDGLASTLHLLWRESGVEMPADAEQRRGFGRELIEEALQFSLDARTELRFGPDGIECSIALPLANVRVPHATVTAPSQVARAVANYPVS